VFILIYKSRHLTSWVRYF